MHKAELMELLANGENSTVEFKRDDVRPEQIAKEIVALANFRGGHLILGVEDDGSISGITRAHNEEWVMEIISQKIHPLLLPSYEKIKFDNDMYVAVISMPPGPSKPYVMRHDGHEDIYIRVGSTSRIATREQQMRLFEIGGMLHTELLPVPRTDINCLDLVRIENYLKDIVHDPEIPQSQSEWNDRLKNMGFLTETHGLTYCTIAGLVLFGKSPRTFLRQYGIRIIVYPTLEKSYKTLFDKTLDSPLVGRIDSTGQTKKIIDKGIIDLFIEATDPYISFRSEVVEPDLSRSKYNAYPLEAIRESVLNALVHRDWTRSIEIEINIYPDRMEIVSPGALPNSMSVEKMKAGQRSPRNPIILEILRDYGYVDNRGMGVRTKIIPLMRKHNNTEPVFIATEDSLQTILYQYGNGPAV
jgi:ATP-dependent DNA helicase RecG